MKTKLPKLKLVIDNSKKFINRQQTIRKLNRKTLFKLLRALKDDVKKDDCIGLVVISVYDDGFKANVAGPFDTFQVIGMLETTKTDIMKESR